MSKLIDRVSTHYEHVLSKGLLGPIDVPEWDAKIYYRGTTTLADESRVIKLTQEGKTTEALVVSLIMRARDDKGELLFDMGDRIKLMNSADPAVILRVITEMGAAEKEALDDIKN